MFLEMGLRVAAPDYVDYGILSFVPPQSDVLLGL